jgi:hypothetical protein
MYPGEAGGGAGGGGYNGGGAGAQIETADGVTRTVLSASGGGGASFASQSVIDASFSVRSAEISAGRVVLVFS